MSPQPRQSQVFPQIGEELRHNITGLSGRNTVLLIVLVVWLLYGCLRLSRSAQVMMATAAPTLIHRNFGCFTFGVA